MTIPANIEQEDLQTLVGDVADLTKDFGEMINLINEQKIAYDKNLVDTINKAVESLKKLNNDIKALLEGLMQQMEDATKENAADGV